MEFQIIALIVLVIATIIFASYYFSKKATIKRKLRKARIKKISDFVHGEIAKTTGRVEFAGKPLVSPLSGRTCAYYYVHIEQKVSTGNSSHWKTLIEEEVSAKFVIRDGDYCAFINSNNLKSYLVRDREYYSGFMEDATEVLEKYLRVHGQKSEGFLGLNKSLRYKEGILEEREEIAVLGKGEWKSAFQVNLPDNYDRVLVISSTDDESVYMSDDPGTIKSSLIQKNIL